MFCFLKKICLHSWNFHAVYSSFYLDSLFLWAFSTEPLSMHYLNISTSVDLQGMKLLFCVWLSLLWVYRSPLLFVLSQPMPSVRNCSGFFRWKKFFKKLLNFKNLLRRFQQVGVEYLWHQEYTRAIQYPHASWNHLGSPIADGLPVLST